MHRTERLLEPYIAGELPTRRSHKVESHLRECADCRLELATLRRRRLRAERFRHAAARAVPGMGLGAAGPTIHGSFAGGDVHAARSAGGRRPLDAPAPVEAAPAPAGDRARWTRPAGDDHSTEETARRRLALPVLGLTVVCSLIAGLLAAAWTIGGPPGTASADAAAAGGSGTVWDEAGTELDPSAVVRLQNDGWNLPDLSYLGYEPVRALGFVADGQPRVELTYEGPAGTIALVERRKSEAETTAGDPSVAADASRLAAEASADADQTPQAADGTDGADEPAAPSFGLHGVLVRHAVVPKSPTARELDGESTSIDTPAAAYTLTVPEGGPREAVVNRVVLTEYSQLDHAPAADDDALSRLARGFARLGLFDARR